MTTPITDDLEDARHRVRHARRASPRNTPAWVAEIPERIGALLIDRHLCPAGDVWGLAKRVPNQELPYDEHGSAVFIKSAVDYDLFGLVGGWSEEARQDVIQFWQSWQSPDTGRFIDPRYPERIVNEKYIVFLLDALGAEPLYAHTTTSATGEIRSDTFLQRAADDPDWERGGWGVGSHTGFMARELLDAINGNGREDLIPDLEEGLRLILTHQDPRSGLWGPPGAPLDSRIGGTLKIIGRLYFMMGMEVPHAQQLADSLVRHQADGDWFDSSVNICILRNVAEVAGFCLETLDSRRQELWDTLESVTDDLRAWRNEDGSYCDNRGESGGISQGVFYACGLIGGYLHWVDCPLPNPLTRDPMTRGVQHRLRPEFQPDGTVTLLAR